MKKLLCLSMLIFALLAQFAIAQTPIAIKGVAIDSEGMAIPDGNKIMTFTIYNSREGTEPIWQEQQTVPVEDGYFIARLGRTKDLDVSFEDALWLGMKIGDGEEMKPRMKVNKMGGDFTMSQKRQYVTDAAQVNQENAVDRDGATTTTKSVTSTTAPPDQVILDDLIVDGSLCVGQDCVNGESFGFDTIRLKENNLRIRFVDTSNTASFPTNDWQLTANDSENGGKNKFSIDDIDGGRTPFTIEASAPSHSIYVKSNGTVGFGTSSPVVELHVDDSDTPTMRLQQNGSSGWSPQTWDVAGNEANFFIRDATNGSTLPFRIQPGAPGDALCLKSDGKVGIGTRSPSFPLELETYGENALFVAERIDGATAFVSGSSTETYFGSLSSHDLNFVVNNISQVKIDVEGNLHLLGDAGVDGIIFPDGSKQTSSGGGSGGGGYWTKTGSDIYYNSGNVGIGTTNPSDALHIEQSGDPVIRIKGSGTIPYFLGCYSGSGLDYGIQGVNRHPATGAIADATKFTTSIDQMVSSTNAHISFGTSQTAGGNITTHLLITSDGNVGIGEANPSNALDVNGSVEVNGTVVHASDIKWKKNIKTITAALDKVNRMRGVTFDWRRDEFVNKNFEKETQIGFIAQEVEEVIPEFVRTDQEGNKSVTYANVAALLVEAIKDQQIIIEQQQATIDAVNAQLAQLEMAIQNLAQQQVLRTSTIRQQSSRNNISLPRVQIQKPRVEQEIDENGRPVGSAQPRKEIKN